MDEFDRYRADMNEKLLGSNHLGIKRFFALDTQAYEDGALDKRTKELLGLVASIVLALRRLHYLSHQAERGRGSDATRVSRRLQCGAGSRRLHNDSASSPGNRSSRSSLSRAGRSGVAAPA